MEARENNLWQQMKQFIANECLLKKEFQLSAGSKSTYYFDIKKATLNGSFLSWASEYIIDFVLPKNKLEPKIVGGMTLGADFLTAGLIQKAFEKGHPMVYGSIVRKEVKKHGTQSKIENEVFPKAETLVIEDVITSGASIISAGNSLIQAGYRVTGYLTVVDREEGGMEKLSATYPEAKILSLFKASDFKT